MVYRIYWFIEIVNIVFCLSRLYGRKMELDIKTLGLVSIDMILMQLVNDGIISSGLNVMIYPMLIFYCWGEFGKGLKIVIVNCCIAMILLGGLQVVLLALMCLMPIDNMDSDVLILLVYIIELILCIIFSYIVDLRKISSYFQKPSVLIKIILALGIFLIVYCIISTRSNQGLISDDYFSTIVFVFIAGVMSTSWIKYKTKAIEAESELHAYKLYEQSFENLLLEIRMKQHNINNHISAIYSQHALYDTYEDLVRCQVGYCEQIKEDSKYSRLLKAGNSVIIGFLYGKFLEADKLGVDISYDVQVMNFNTNVPVYKLVEIMGNLLNNAYEAVADKVDKRVNISIREDTEQLSITVENTYPYTSVEEIGKYFKKGYSHKGNNRGLGLYSVKSLSKEYGFNLICTNNNRDGQNWLSFQIEVAKLME